MRKTTKICMYTLTAALLMAGCSQKEPASTETTAASSAEATESTAHTEAPAEEIPDGSVELGEYKGMEATKTVAAVTDEAVEAKIQSILESNAEFVETEEAAQNGDMVNIDYVGKLDGEAFEGGTAEKTDLTLGSGMFIPGFEEGLIGVKKGEKRDLNLTFPDPYKNPDLAGKEVVFEVTVNTVNRRQVPEFNDEFVQSINPDMKTTDEYIAEVRAGLEESEEQIAVLNAQNEVVLQVLENSKFTDIEPQVEAQFGELWEQTVAIVEAYGMGMADYAAFYGTDEEGLEELLHTQVENSVKLGLVSQAIAAKEGLAVEESDREAMAAAEGMDKETLLSTYGQEMIDEYIIQTKAVDFIVEHAVIK